MKVERVLQLVFILIVLIQKSQTRPLYQSVFDSLLRINLQLFDFNLITLYNYGPL